MDQNSISKIAPPVQQTSPEEDAKLLAIEALEAQSVDLDMPPMPVEQPAPQPIPAEIIAPQPIVPAPSVQPPVQQTPAVRMAEAIANEPAPKRFQFFLHQKPPRKQFVIGGLVLVIIGLCVGAYFTLS